MTVSGPKRLAQDPQQQKLYLAAGVGIALLVVVALGVVFVLPTTLEPEQPSVEKSSNSPVATPLPSAPITSPASPQRPAAADADPEETRKQRQSAESLLRDTLRRRAELEGEGIETWGVHKLVTSYPEALAALDAANAAFDAAAYEEASQGFGQVMRLFEKLQASKGERFRLAMTEGNAALASDNPTSALAAFTVAVAIAPDDLRAATGLKRAQSLPEILELMRKGRRLDLAGELDAAHGSFRAAADLDASYLPAQDEAARTGQLISERDYRNAVSEAIRAIDAGQFRSATGALSAARKIRPNAPEIRELQLRLKQERQRAAIRSLSRRARNAVANEEWETAAAEYQRILKIDPAAAAAKTGLKQSQRMVRLHSQIGLYLNDPDRLSSDAPLDHARQLLRAAGSLKSSGPRLTADVSRLGELIETASQPRPVLLRSDGHTSVTIYRVARFGMFSEKKVDLRPGKYTAVGTRPGFRDVRVEFRVSPTGATTTLVVQCVERI